MTIDCGSGVVVQVPEYYQRYCEWCAKVGIPPSPEKSWCKTIDSISGLRVIAFTNPRRYGA